MPHKTTKKIKERLTEKRKAEQVKAARRERKNVEAARAAKKKVRRVQRRATQPVRNVAQAGRNVAEAGGEAATIAKAKTPFVSSFESRGGSSTATKASASRDTGTEAQLDTERERKIVLAQQLRNEGLTLEQVGQQIGMSASWVSANTVPAAGGGGSSSQQSSGGFLDDLSSTFESIENDIFGGGEGGAEDIDMDLDKMLDGIDEQFSGKDGDFDIDLKGL